MIRLVGIFRSASILLLTLLAAPTDASELEFRERFEKTDPRDGKALLDLGAWCESRNRSSWAERCYRKVLALGKGSHFAEASYRLARIELQKKLHDRAYTRLRSLLSDHEHPEARALLEKAENASTRKQRELVERGDRLYRDGDYKEAREVYEEAYELYPGKETTAAFVPESRLLRRLAAAMDHLDDEFYRRKIRPIERSVHRCTRSGCEGGFAKCRKCSGTGRIRMELRTGRVRRVVYVDCSGCLAFKWEFCPTCVGLESTTDNDKLTDTERKALTRVLNKVRSLKVLKLRLPSALEQVENVILRVDESATLNFFRSIRPAYSHSKELRNALGSVPPTPGALRAASAGWKSAARDIRSRAGFLLGYACEFARYIQQFDMLRGSRRRPDPDSLPALSPEHDSVVGPGVLAAFPDDGMKGWVRVKGILQGFKESSWHPYHGRVLIRGTVSHKINFFVWSPAAKEHLERLAKGPWRNRVTGLDSRYPFQIGEKLEHAPSDHHVVVVGRFLRDRLGFPRNWFEVWGVAIGLSDEQERIYRALSESIEISFTGVPVGKIASFLKVWFGVAIEFDGVDQNVRVSCESRGAPVARLLDALAGTLGVEWYFDSGKAIFCRHAPGKEAKDLAAVLKRFGSRDQGQVLARRGGAPREAAQRAETVAELPADPSELKALAAKAMAEMDYSLAGRCYRKLYEEEKSKKRRSDLARRVYKILVLHALTRNTPVSHLVGASDLSRITIRNRSGEESRQTVRVIERTADHFVVQPSYGGRARVRRDRIRGDEPISAREWRSSKERDFQRQLEGIEGVSAQERLSRLFLAALFSKTNKLQSHGTDLLEKAIAEDAFPWLLETYFPDDREKLSEFWRKATSRHRKTSPQPSRTPEPEPEPEPIVAEAHLEPLPRSDDALYPFARKHYRQGGRYLAGSLPGMDNAPRMRKQALEHFELSRKAVERLLAAEPDHADANRLRYNVTIAIQTCVKDLGFFD